MRPNMLSQRNERRTLAIKTMLLAATTTLLAVTPFSTGQGDADTAARLGKLYDVFAHGSVAEARDSMEEALRWLKARSLEFENAQHSAQLFETHKRMYLIELASGRPDQAYVEFIRAKYWYVRTNLLRGLSVSRVAALTRKLDEAAFRRLAISTEETATRNGGPAFARAAGLYGNAEDRQVDGEER